MSQHLPLKFWLNSDVNEPHKKAAAAGFQKDLLTNIYTTTVKTKEDSLRICDPSMQNLKYLANLRSFRAKFEVSLYT